MEVITCRQEKLGLLYHYQALHPCWLRALLHSGRIRFSNPSALNDPWDCAPCYDESCVEDEAARGQLVDWFEVMHRREYAGAAKTRQWLGIELVVTLNFCAGSYNKLRVPSVQRSPDNTASIACPLALTQFLCGDTMPINTVVYAFNLLRQIL